MGGSIYAVRTNYRVAVQNRGYIVQVVDNMAGKSPSALLLGSQVGVLWPGHVVAARMTWFVGRDPVLIESDGCGCYGWYGSC